MEIRVQAPAKLNLFLWLAARQADGFHPITSVMQTISLYDEIRITVDPGADISMDVHGAEPLDSARGGENLAYRAAQKFYGELRTRRQVQIELHKAIPIAAGLGGGSSDAAAVLLGLNELHNRPFSLEKLRELGINLGSDVPFFVTGGTALCRGRGEIIDPLPVFEGHFVLVSPHLGISTSWAYKQWDTKGKATVVEPRKLEGRRWQKFMGQNDFETVLFDEYPKLKNWKDRLRELGAEVAGLSGSGPSVYSKFATKALAEKAVSQLPTFDANIYVVQTIPQGVTVWTPDLSLVD